jgi:hypothetical protein
MNQDIIKLSLECVYNKSEIVNRRRFQKLYKKKNFNSRMNFNELSICGRTDDVFKQILV